MDRCCQRATAFACALRPTKLIDYEEMFRGAMQARAMVANPDQWADSDRDQVNTRHYLSTSMRVALDRGEFFLVYQPIIRLADNRIIGAEALLRWEHRRWARYSRAGSSTVPRTTD